MIGTFFINNEQVKIDFKPHLTLLNLLREVGYTEVKNGCEEGECGACTVLIDDKPVPSCQVLAASVVERNIITIKGLGNQHKPNIIQKAFSEAGAVQCGFCTPGMVIATYALLRDNSNPTEEQIKRALDGNLCRCTGYIKIIEGVKLAADRIQGLEIKPA